MLKREISTLEAVCFKQSGQRLVSILHTDSIYVVGAGWVEQEILGAVPKSQVWVATLGLFLRIRKIDSEAREHSSTLSPWTWTVTALS